MILHYINILKFFCVENHTMTVSIIRSLAVPRITHLIFVTFEIWTVSSPKYDLLCKRNSCDCATCVATFFDKFCDSHTSELDTLCDKSRAPQNPPTSDHELARLQLPPLQRAFTSFQPPPQRGHYFLMMLFAQIWQSFAT